jgi:hypothetical protein
MRTLLFATLMASAALPAAAASIEKIGAGRVNDESILKITCTTCDGQAPVAKHRYQVPALDGVASMEIIDQGGKPEVVRVDKFMGGSPVMTKSKTQGPLIEEIHAAEQKAHDAKVAARNAELQAIDMKRASILPPDERGLGAVAGIDRDSTTAAVGPEGAAFDPAKLTLRLR